MKNNWLIIADDLTGAADCAIAFGRHGFTASVRWGGMLPTPAERTQIFSYNADSREMDAVSSAALHRDLLEKLWSEEAFLYRKIDSTLRGQPAADIAETLAFLKEKTGKGLGILAPAFPATGRLTRNGRVVVNNIRLEDTELWKYDHSYPTSDMKEIMKSAGLKCGVLTLDHIRSGIQKLSAEITALESAGYDVIVFDTEKNSDLQIIAEAALNGDISRFFIGSAGLAHALVPLFEAPQQPGIVPFANDGSILVVVGSLATASRDAAKELAGKDNIEHCLVTPETLLNKDGSLQEFSQKIGALLAEKRNVLIETVVAGRPDMSLGPKLAKALAQSLKPYAHTIGALAATGGETASALMDAFGMNGICLFDEIEPGVSLGMTTGQTELPIATKAGAFGNRYSLSRIFDRLIAIKEEGNLG